MAIPNWNAVELAVPTNLAAANEVTWNLDQSIRVNTVHYGRASYSERGTTSYSIIDIIHYGLENEFIDRQSYDEGMMPTLELLTEIAEDMFSEDADCDDMADTEYDDWEESDYEFEPSTLVS